MIIEYGDDGERYSYPPELHEAGSFEGCFDGKNDALGTLWHTVPIDGFRMRHEAARRAWTDFGPIA